MKKRSKVPHALVIDNRVSDGAFMTYYTMLECLDSGHVINHEYLAKTQVKSKRSISTHIKILKDSGWITVVCTGRENDYILHKSNLSNLS